MRVAFLMHGIFYGGASRSLFLLLKSLSKFSDVESFIYATSSRSKVIKEELGRVSKSVHIISINKQLHYNVYGDSMCFENENSSEQIIDFTNIINANKIDILHINSSVFAPSLEEIRKRCKAKIIVHVRENIDQLLFGDTRTTVISNIIRNSDGIIAISENESEPFKDHHCLNVLPNPFNFLNIRTSNGEFRKKMNYSDSLVLVAMMSHFSKNKGHEDFIKAADIIVKTGTTKVLFLIVGVKINLIQQGKRVLKKILKKEDLYTSLQKIIKQKQLQQNVRFIPYTNDIFSVLSGIDIFVRPSVLGDPWGRDIIEAMAMKLPVVATGKSEVFVKNNETGYLVPANNPTEMAYKITILINDKEKRANFGNMGCERIKSLCDMNLYGEKIYKIYLDILK